MNRIKSFTINHNLLMPGFYISREDGDVITYDLRTRKPNAIILYGRIASFILDRWDVRPDFICWFVTAEVRKKCLP